MITKQPFKLNPRSKGNSSRPRLSVFRSSSQIAAQIIDDEKGKTLAAFSSLKLKKGAKDTKTALAFGVGEKLAKLALKKGIKKVVFDRRSFAYHGRLKALAEGARRAGLKF